MQDNQTNSSSLLSRKQQALETYNYHKAKEAFRNYKNATRKINGALSSDESSSVIDNTSSSDETSKEQQIDLLSCKKDLRRLFTNSSDMLAKDELVDAVSVLVVLCVLSDAFQRIMMIIYL